MTADQKIPTFITLSPNSTLPNPPSPASAPLQPSAAPPPPATPAPPLSSSSLPTAHPTRPVPSNNPARSGSASEEALSRQLDGASGGRHMGLRGRRITATTATMSGTNGGERQESGSVQSEEPEDVGDRVSSLLAGPSSLPMAKGRRMGKLARRWQVAGESRSSASLTARPPARGSSGPLLRRNCRPMCCLEGPRRGRTELSTRRTRAILIKSLRNPHLLTPL